MRIFALLLIATFFKGLVWQAILPIWQVPDEQAHFAQLSYYVEKKTQVIDSEKNLSQEILVSEELLGTRRDQFGNNKFTYHPEYRIEYSSGLFGPFETTINQQAKSSRTNMVGQESAGYPPLYYLLALPVYSLFYDFGLIDRLFMVRLISVLLNVLLVYVAYRIGWLVWARRSMALALAMLVGFQPMISYVAAGFHPDNLLNLLYSLGILVLLLMIKNGVKLGLLGLLGLLGFLGLQTKILMVFFLPVAAGIVVYKFFRERLIGLVLAMSVLLLPLISIFMLWPLPYMPKVTAGSPLAGLTFFEYLKFRIPKLLFEVWPWYWGVFKWLGVTLPPIAMKIVTRVAIVAGIGLGLKFFQAVKNRNFHFGFKALIFFLLSSIFYVLYLVVWDWRLMQSVGFSQGLQGRYLFPNIVGQMGLILAGILVFVPRKFGQWRGKVAGILAIGMIVLNAVALATIAGSYYDLSSWRTFLIQLAQYKPGIVKAFATMFL